MRKKHLQECGETLVEKVIGTLAHTHTHTTSVSQPMCRGICSGVPTNIKTA